MPEPTLRTMPQVVASAAARHGTRTAILDGSTALSYTELDAARRRSAAGFVAAGLQKGDRIAIWAPNIHEWIVAAVGAQSLGVVLVPVNTRWKGAEAATTLRLSKVKVLFTVGDFLGQRYPSLLAGEDLPDLQQIVLLRESAAAPDAPSNTSTAAAPADATAESPAADASATPDAPPNTSTAAAPQTPPNPPAPVRGWQDFLAAGADIDDAQIDTLAAAVTPDDVLDIGFTSGTTGTPKGVVTTHGQNIRVFETWSDTVGLDAGDNYLIVNPFFHSFGYKAGWLASIIRGAKIIPMQTFDLDQVLACIERESINVLPGAPTIYQSMLAHPRRGDYDLSSLRLAATGAAPVPVELVRRMREELNFQVVVTAYGLTESCGTVTICRPDDPPELISGSSGRAIEGVEVQVVDGAGKALRAGKAGEVWVRGYNVMQGYLDDPEATAQAITPEGWLKTGDVGVMDANGYLDITDRIKDVFIVGGFNCYPAEIENMLCSLAGVSQAAVVGMPDERMGEVACAFLVPDLGAKGGAGAGGKAGADAGGKTAADAGAKTGAADASAVSANAPLNAAAVIAWCRDNMANYKVPRAVFMVDSLPLNATGKVMKDVLRQRAAEWAANKGAK